MKYIALLPLFLVVACVQTQDDTMVSDNDKPITPVQEDVFEEIDTSVDAIPLPHPPSYQEQQPAAETTSAQPAQPTQSTQSVQPTYPTQPAYTQPVPTTYQQQSMQRTPDGNVIIELPPQQIYIPTENYQQPYLGEPVQEINTPVSFSQPAQATQPAYGANLPPMQPTVAPILLQYPGRPDLQVQCASNDAACITSFEQQGFVQVRYMPQFAGYQDIPVASDYPTTGRWRHQNNIPRW